MSGRKRAAIVDYTVHMRQIGLDISIVRPTQTIAKKQPSPNGNSLEKGERSMLFYTKIVVRKYERGLLYKDGDFQQFLGPGTYRLFDPYSRLRGELFNMAHPAFSHALLDYFATHERDQVARLFKVVETGANESALVFHNERAYEVMGPLERKFYWKGLIDTRVERFDFGRSFKIDNQVAKKLFDSQYGTVRNMARDAVYVRIVRDGHVGLLRVDGVLTEALPAGAHAFWRFRRDVNVEPMDIRVNSLDVKSQEIMTKDKVSLRINLVATYRFEDALKATRATKEPLNYLSKEIRIGLRAAVSRRTLDELLEDKFAIGRAVAERLAEQFTNIGIDVSSIGVKDILLPGDMKVLLRKVVEAEKVAQANVIRRREETNASRSLLNTAKVIESNQVALRLKELETLEKVTEKVGTLSVYGGLEGVLNGLVHLKQ